MSTNAHFATGLTGGAATDLDYIDGSSVNDGDFALVMSGSSFYVYKLDATSGATENSPYIISPDSNAGTKRWIQQFVPWVSDTGEMFLKSNWVKDPQHMLWYVGHETYLSCDDGYVAGDISTYAGDKILTSSTTWGYWAAWGDTTQVTADNTYVTVTNVTSGAGVLTNIISPGVTSISDTVSIKVTVDGTAYEYTFTAAAATDRFFAGAVMERGQVVYNSSSQNQGVLPCPMDWSNAGLVSGIASRLDSGYINLLVPPHGVLQLGVPVVRFETSLKVEMKSSDYTGTNERDYCGVIYTLDQ